MVRYGAPLIPLTPVPVPACACHNLPKRFPLPRPVPLSSIACMPDGVEASFLRPFRREYSGNRAQDEEDEANEKNAIRSEERRLSILSSPRLYPTCQIFFLSLPLFTHSIASIQSFPWHRHLDSLLLSSELQFLVWVIHLLSAFASASFVACFRESVTGASVHVCCTSPGSEICKHESQKTYISHQNANAKKCLASPMSQILPFNNKRPYYVPSCNRNAEAAQTDIAATV
jgi:hypothetical protein